MSRCEDAAGYVVGALTPAERAAFEEHLPGCSACRHTVRDLAGLPGLLSRVSADDLEEPPLPPTLVPGLVRRMRTRRRRRQLLVGLAAAAAVVAAAVGTWAVLDSPPASPVQVQPAPDATPGTRMDEVVASHVQAFAELHPKAWGTEVVIHCSYDEREYGEPQSYALVVVDRSGRAEQVATWAVAPGRDAKVTGSSDLPRSAIAAVEVRTRTGVALLRMTP